MLHFLWMFLIGIVVGAIARLLMPGAEIPVPAATTTLQRESLGLI